MVFTGGKKAIKFSGDNNLPCALKFQMIKLPIIIIWKTIQFLISAYDLGKFLR